MRAVDILIPHFEDPEGFELSLASIEQQSWDGNIRVIVVDDGSSPATFLKIKSITENTTLDVRLLQNEQNQGRPKTRNRLLDAAEHDFIAWLDAGDEWYPEKLRIQFTKLAQLEESGADLGRVWVTCDYDWKWSGGTARRTPQITDGDQLEKLLIGDGLRAYLWTLLGTREAFQRAGRFDDDLPRMQDLDYFIKFVANGGTIHNTDADEPLCIYHKSDEGRSAKQVYSCYQRILEKNEKKVSALGRSNRVRIQYKAYALGARYSYNNHDYIGFLKYTLKGAVRQPRYFTYRLRRRLFRNVRTMFRA